MFEITKKLRSILFQKDRVFIVIRRNIVIYIIPNAILAALILVIFYQYIFGQVNFIEHPDEPRNAFVLHRMIDNFSLNPNSFNYPSLFYYANAPGQIVAAFLSDDSIYLLNQGVGNSYAPVELVVIFYRITSLIFHVMTVLFVYVFIASRLGVALGSVASFLTAFSPLVLSFATFFAPDVFATFFVTLCLVFTCRVVEHGQLKDFMWGGACRRIGRGVEVQCWSCRHCLVCSRNSRASWTR